MLDSTQLDEFDELGFTRIRGFDEDAAEPMRAAAWRELEQRYRVRPDMTSGWPIHVTGMRHTKQDPAFTPIGGPPLSAALDQLLGPGAWTVPKHWGQVMITPPGPGTEWHLPARLWHGRHGV